MPHGHGHAPAAASASGRYVRRLAAALAITLAFTVLELIVGIATSSLALISDAGHMVTDVVGVAMALTAILLARRSGPTTTRTFGLYRGEVLAALGNALLLFAVAGYVLYEAIARLSGPPEVPGLPAMLVGAAGLLANVAAFLLLRTGAQESLNIRGAYLEVLADLVGSVGVLLSGAIILLTGWPYTDLIIGVAIGLFVLPRAAVLARRALRILFQHAPERVDVGEVGDELAALPGVVGVHDLHVWTLTSGMEVASAHLTVTGSVRSEDVLSDAQHLLASQYAIEHATFQVEARETARRCEQLSW